MSLQNVQSVHGLDKRGSVTTYRLWGQVYNLNVAKRIEDEARQP